MGIVRVLIFASLVAGTLGFFWPKFGQENEEIRPWDLADQMEEAARLEELCQQDDPYCFSTYIQYTVYSGAFGSFRHDQKYSRLRCLLHVKGLVIGFYLGWSGHTLLIRKI